MLAGTPTLIDPREERRSRCPEVARSTFTDPASVLAMTSPVVMDRTTDPAWVVKRPSLTEATRMEPASARRSAFWQGPTLMEPAMVVRRTLSQGCMALIPPALRRPSRHAPWGTVTRTRPNQSVQGSSPARRSRPVVAVWLTVTRCPSASTARIRACSSVASTVMEPPAPGKVTTLREDRSRASTGACGPVTSKVQIGMRSFLNSRGAAAGRQANQPLRVGAEVRAARGGRDGPQWEPSWPS